MLKRTTLLSLMSLITLTGIQAQAASTSAAEMIYTGRIITMVGSGDDARARAEAVAVSGDRIVAVGTRAEVLRLHDRNTRIVDLGSAALLPGFIDAHGHLTGTASALSAANLSAPPVGTVRNIADVQKSLRQFIVDRHIPPGTVVTAFGYDDAQLEERRHPTRDDLDAVSTEHPILVSHVSGHLSAANSAMLKLAGIEASTPDPSGGVIRRRENSREPNGVLEETASNLVRAKLPAIGLEETLDSLKYAMAYYASNGITTVQDGAVIGAQRPMLDEAARRGLLPLDVVTYHMWTPVMLDLKSFKNSRNYDHGLKHYGIKLILDGSPQGKTAFLSQPYFKPPAGKPANYAGYPTLPADAVTKAITEAAARDIPVLAHANGDAAAEMLIEAVTAVRKADPNAKPDVVMIHAQTVRDDQLDRMAQLGMRPSFFVAHTYYWGDWHRDETLGPVRAERISPTRSAIDRGLSITLHNDAPVVPPNMLNTVWSATTRRTRSGDILGPMQRLTTWEALRGITINAARQAGDDSLKGSIEVGKQADFVVLSTDPLTIDPEKLRDVRVLQTIAHGKVVWRAEN
jgi:predicted amidohydrolase YtcJ